MNHRFGQINVVCYNCNKSGHIAIFCRSKNVNRKGPTNKKINVQTNDKGKVKVDEIKNQMKKTWVKMSDTNIGNWSTPKFGARNYFGN